MALCRQREGLDRIRATVSLESNAMSQSDDAVQQNDLRSLAKDLSRLIRLAAESLDDEKVNEFALRLEEHLGAHPSSLNISTTRFPSHQLVDIHLAFEAWSGDGDRALGMIGFTGDHIGHWDMSDLLSPEHDVRVGALEYAEFPVSPDSTKTCVTRGAALLRDGGRTAAIVIRGSDPDEPMGGLLLAMLATDDAFGRSVMAELRVLSVRHSVIRGQVLSLGGGEGHRHGGLTFMRRPTLEREELVLPEDTIGRIERHVAGVAAHEERLRAAGLHLKRGVLLYGPPGTGKTHTVRYLLSQLKGRTAFVLSGQALGAITTACTLARIFTPSIVILEDVDLIASDRSFVSLGSNPLLFEVLNQIDGLGDDVDVTFLLTTNRVDVLERALSERPGRVDAAIEVGVPDADGRERLFRLYGRSAGIEAVPSDALAAAIEATEGRTAVFIREVVRRAALLFSERGSGPIRLSGELLAEAATAFVHDQEELAKSKLRGPEEPDAPPPPFGRAGLGARRVSYATRGHFGIMGPGGQFVLGGGPEEPPPYVTDETD